MEMSIKAQLGVTFDKLTIGLFTYIAVNFNSSFSKHSASLFFCAEKRVFVMCFC